MHSLSEATNWLRVAMIFYGWRYYSKRDFSYRRDQCPRCGQLVDLTSYTTQRFGHLYWIPVLPMGRYRMLDECPLCHSGRELLVRDWSSIRESTYLPLLDLARGGKLSDEEALEFIERCRSFGTREEFASVAPALLREFLGNARVMSDIGWLFFNFGMQDEARAALVKAVGLQDDDVAKARLEVLDRTAQQILRKIKEPGLVTRMGPLFAIPALLLLGLAWASATALSDRPERVFIVNGLARDYEVLVNGARRNLPALGYTEVDLDYGPVLVEPVAGSRGPVDPVSAEIRAGFYERLFGDPVYVLNPDRMAVLVLEDVAYRSDWSDDSEPVDNRYVYRAGESFYKFDDVLSAFIPMPEQISADSRRDVEFRTRLDHAAWLEPVEAAGLLMATDGQEAALDYARGGLDLVPEDEALLGILVYLSEPGKAIRFLETRLADRPILVDWHRQYQDLVESADPARDLEAEYSRLLESDRSNGHLMYLLGRVTDDRTRALELMRDAMVGDHPSAYGFHGTAYHHLLRGQYERALEFERRATGMMPEKALFRRVEEELLLATGRLDELLERRLEELGESGVNADLAGSLLLLYGMKGDTSAAARFVGEYLGEPGEVRPETAGPEIAAIMSRLPEGAGDAESYAAWCGGIDEPVWQFRAAAARRELERAASMVDEEKADAALGYLLLYSLALSDRNAEVGAYYMIRATSLLERESGPMDVVAGWLAPGASAPELDDVYEAGLQPSVQAILLTALGFRHQGQRAAFHAAARRANFDPSFPGLILDEIL